MNILIVCNHYAVASGRYMSDAFTRLGHAVKHIGKPMGREIWGLTLPQRYVWTPENEQWVEVSRFGADNYWHPDLYLIMDSDPAILDSMKPQSAEFDVPMVVYGVDNHVRDYRRPYFDHYFLAHRNVSQMAWEHPYDDSWKYSDGIALAVATPENEPNADMTHLPCAQDPTIFTPSTIPYSERAYDVCMIGYMYEQRWNVVQRLRAAGLKVLAGTGLVYESYADAYRNSRISLCLSVNGDVAQRIFETAACGCVIVSDKCADFDLLKPPGIWTIDSDPVAEIQGILADPDTAQAMAAQSTAWAQQHTWDARAQVIVDWYKARYPAQAHLAEWSQFEHDLNDTLDRAERFLKDGDE